MPNRIIQVFEHESLKLGQRDGFGERELKLLQKFRGDKGDDDFHFYSLINNGVKFKQFVGVLCVGDLQIEVLPKVDRYSCDKDNEYGVWHNNLLAMLKTVYKLKVDVPSQAQQKIIHSNSILDVFIQRFLDEVERLLHIGLVKSYRRVEDNCKALKGKLLVDKQITRNFAHKERFFVNYTTYDYNHVCNRIIYKALKLIPYVTDNSYVKARANTIRFEFPELNDISIDEGLFYRMEFNRKTEEYHFSMELAKLLLLHYMPNLTNSNNEKVLALMFDMNKLWEEYVFILLKRQLPEYHVMAQNTKQFWHSDSVGNKTIRPDIVVIKGGDCVAVLDTKWKCPADNKPSDADLKQMYTYHKYWDTNYTALIYPGSASNVEGHFEKGNEECRMIYLPLVHEQGPDFLNISELVNFVIEISAPHVS